MGARSQPGRARRWRGARGDDERLRGAPRRRRAVAGHRAGRCAGHLRRRAGTRGAADRRAPRRRRADRSHPAGDRRDRLRRAGGHRRHAASPRAARRLRRRARRAGLEAGPGARRGGARRGRIVAVGLGVGARATAVEGAGMTRARLQLPVAAHVAEEEALDAMRTRPPLLPRLSQRPPRWQSPHWLGLQMRPLVKHVALDWSAYLVTPGEWAPAGFRPAYHLGAASLVPQPNTVRLVEADGRYMVQAEHEPLPAGGRALGYISSTGLAEMEPLERRRLRFDDGEIEVLCAGPADPHLRESELIERLGWIEPYPIAPRAAAGAGRRRTSRLLVRRQEPRAWRHVLLAV